MSKIWFVTGSSRGFGRQFVQAALERGDKVAATARTTDSLADLVAAHGPALLKIVDAENPPLRVFFGDFPLHFVPQVYAERLKTWQEWAVVATQAQGSAA